MAGGYGRAMTLTRKPIELTWTADGGVGRRARLGLIVLASDLTIETELRQLPLDGVAINHSRIANELHVTPETLTAMQHRLPTAAALLPVEFEFDAIGYGCTSASTLIGDKGVAAGIQSAHPGVATTNPIQAALAAFEALGATRIGIVTPYSEIVTMPIIERFETEGFEVPAFGSFLIEDDLTVGRLSPQSVADGLGQVGLAAECDAFFVSCTSVALFEHVDELEAQFGRPVVSSNVALAWHLLRTGGIDDQFTGFGALFAQH